MKAAHMQIGHSLDLARALKATACLMPLDQKTDLFLDMKE